MTELLYRRVRTTPRRVLFVADGRRVTAAELLEATERLAAGLRSIGVRAGDDVSWQLPNWRPRA